MDIASLMNTILSGSSISNMSQLTGASNNEVESVLNSVLPSLVSGAEEQAANAETAAGFMNALQDHAKVDTSDLASFISNVDLADGGKILSHLLGANKESATQAAAEKAGLDIGKTGSILSAVAPLLMSLMGQQNAQTQQAAQTVQNQKTSLLGGLFSKLFSGLFGGK